NGAACCANTNGGTNRCQTGLSCQGGGGGAAQMCAPCGTSGAACCAGNTCTTAGLGCANPGGGMARTCEACALGAACCAGGICASGSACVGSMVMGGMRTGGMCNACGGSGQPCCGAVGGLGTCDMGFVCAAMANP